MRAYKIVATVVAVPMLLFGMGGVAVADDISNNIDASIDSVVEVMPLNVGGPNGSTTLYVSKTGTGGNPTDGKSGCNLTGSTTLVVSLSSTNAAVATVSPSSVTFTSCDDTKLLTVTPVAAGSATISATQTSNNTGGTFNLAPVTFRVDVTAPAPSNTAPVVAVAGVAGGTTYNKGSVPAATCNVNDAEDGNSSFPATLSTVTGTYASDGIGSQTASCSYTDLGPAPYLTASSSVTYSIVDPSAPVIGYTLTPSIPGGLNGWYIGDVSLVWSVSEPQSPNSLVTVGCVNQSITSDQNATTYTCDATSAGGSATQASVTIKRDATAPTFTATPSAAANGAGFNNGAVDVAYSCSDATSGLAVACPDTDHATTDGTHVFAHTISDQAGNSSSVSTTVNLDATKPTIIGSRTTANGAGWNNTDVTVTFTCTDTGTGASGIKSCVADGTSPASNEKILSADGTNQSVSGTATDNADNTNTTTVGGINIDKTPPVIAFAGRTPANTHGWNNTNVILTWNCTDPDGSGVVDPTVSQTLNTEGTDLSASGTCADLAGNTASDTQSGINIDRTPPVVAYTSASPSANGVGWNNVDVTATFTATDNLSGFVGASLTTTGTATSSGEGEGLTVSSPSFTDLAGNTTAAGAATSVPFKVDKTAPIITFDNQTPGTNPALWNNTAVTVNWQCSDSVSDVVHPGVSEPVSTEGLNQSATGTCEDLAGNTASNKVTGINIDMTAPGVVYTSASPGANPAGWNKTDVIATFTATDSLSGFAGPSNTTTGTATTIGQGEGLTVASPSFTDLAGNTTAAGAATSVPFKVDKTPPTVSLADGPSDGASYYFGSVPAAPTCVASDALSGLDTCLVSGGGTTVGLHSYIATATDKAGNEATATHSYTVSAWTLKGFYQPVDMGGVWNTVKGGSTVPLKFEVFAGATELTSTSVVQSFNTQKISCTSGSGIEDAIEVVSTGGTSLRYDTTGGQFIQNWKTPTGAGNCYSATMTTLDGSHITALFKIK